MSVAVEAKRVARAGRCVGIEAVEEPLCGALHRHAAAVDLDGSARAPRVPRSRSVRRRPPRSRRTACDARSSSRPALARGRIGPAAPCTRVALGHEGLGVRRSRGLRRRTAAQGAQPSRARRPRARRSSANRRPSSRRACVSLGICASQSTMTLSRMQPAPTTAPGNSTESRIDGVRTDAAARRDHGARHVAGDDRARAQHGGIDVGVGEHARGRQRLVAREHRPARIGLQRRPDVVEQLHVRAPVAIDGVQRPPVVGLLARRRRHGRTRAPSARPAARDRARSRPSPSRVRRCREVLGKELGAEQEHAHGGEARAARRRGGRRPVLDALDAAVGADEHLVVLAARRARARTRLSGPRCGTRAPRSAGRSRARRPGRRRARARGSRRSPSMRSLF